MENKHRISILSDDIANKIAAGEVVQRPLSVVKELVENAIDASASIITINLLDSGLEEINIIDNGIGMDKENVALCLTRHATSKVLTEEDIYKIMTLGFRGEALASISAVSNFRLLTSTDGITGYELIKNGDEKQIINDTSANKGTNIKVANLFFNTPARYKHLSTPFYELSLIIQYVNKVALTNPFIKFEVRNNNNQIFSTLGDGNTVNVMQKIYNTEIAKNIINFEAQNEHFKVDFYIVKPQHTRSKKSNIHIAVNHRIIRNNLIEKAIINGYGQYLHTNQFPIVFLNILTDYSLIDINIHPTKEQIKISLFNYLEELIEKSIKENLNKVEYISHPTNFKYNDFSNDDTLQEKELVNLDNLFKNNEENQNLPVNEISEVNNNNDNNNNLEVANTKVEIDNNNIDLIAKEKTVEYLGNNDTSKMKTNNESIKSTSSDITNDDYNEFFIDLEKETIIENKEIANNDVKEEKIQKSIHTQKSLLEDDTFNQTLIKNAKFIGFFHKTYNLYENEEGLYFIDQHAAQERIRYENILKAFSTKNFNTQQILVPIMFDFTTSEFLNVIECLDKFSELGMHFEKFGPNTLRLIEADTIFFKMKNLESTIRTIINMLTKDNKLSLKDLINDIAIEMACKGAIKANDYITNEDAHKLLEELSKCNEPYTCPHGRPIIVNLNQYQIEKMFKRVH